MTYQLLKCSDPNKHQSTQTWNHISPTRHSWYYLRLQYNLILKNAALTLMFWGFSFLSLTVFILGEGPTFIYCLEKVA